jgi:hypothetical protein
MGSLSAQPVIQPARPAIGPLQGVGGKVADLVRCLAGAQANNSRWPTFNGKYVEYPRFRKEWRTYRQTYDGHVKDELACRSLKERSVASRIWILVNDIEDLREAWGHAGHAGYAGHVLRPAREVHPGGPGAYHQV